MERKRKSYQAFTREFKIGVVRLMETSEHPSSKVARELDTAQSVKNRQQSWGATTTSQ